VQDTAQTQETGELKRTIGPFQLTLYALGSMIGSGIYGLIGKAAGQAGNAVWLAFLAALVAALLTALSYASLGSRYPKAGGACYVSYRAFASPLLSFVIGIALICSGLTSVATQSKIFSVNLKDLFGLEAIAPQAIAFGFLLITTGIVFRGIRESMWVNVTATIIEATGLLIVIASGMSYWGSVDYFETPPDRSAMLGVVVLQAAVLTFFAFIGFEDAINVAEECKNPSRTIPIGLACATGLAAILYVTISITAVSVVPWQDLAKAPSPLTEVMRRAEPDFPAWLMTAIALFSVANTALVNYITASRLVYGMATQKLLPDRFGAVHAGRATPHIAIAALFLVLVPLVLIGSITDLASATVLLLLVVFLAVNASLVVLKNRAGEPQGLFEVPVFVPALGFIVCGILLVTRLLSSDWVAPALALGLIGIACAMYAVLRPKGAKQD
jgi:basic amino acid/polyamine antiporter, APA family